MSGFIEGENRYQSTLFPERIDDYVDEDSAARVIDVFIDRLDLSGLGFKTEPADTGRPGYNPVTLLKIFVYGYMNYVPNRRKTGRKARTRSRKACTEVFLNLGVIRCKVLR